MYIVIGAFTALRTIVKSAIPISVLNFVKAKVVKRRMAEAMKMRTKMKLEK
jgi:hypothetical protein